MASAPADTVRKEPVHPRFRQQRQLQALPPPRGQPERPSCVEDDPALDSVCPVLGPDASCRVPAAGLASKAAFPTHLFGDTGETMSETSNRIVWGRNTSSNVMKVLWGLGELGLAFERIDVGGAFGKTDTAEYRAMNPNGVVPTLQEDDFTLWESNAILRY